ncbi:ABC transporter permease [Haloarchaeobius sp. HME9146]|uniref:ABC transporter permease n=1 Tax=Haloarchaeobius sp. HME9146 TaxID=2978732 RepID=UPI0021BF627E|nr:ABC transporter permease [Haloarchaeobius sp. HME9146]MCT9098021.1 ABC transporter permease [Haloarchaeobius sp. HME9146]
MTRQRYRRCLERFGAGACSIEEIRSEVELLISIDPGQSIPEAFVTFITNIVVHQEFGTSLQYNEPVFDLLFAAMPWSVFVSIWGLVLGFTFNIFWGALLAYREGSRFDKGGTIFAMVGNSIPYYVAGILALAVFGYNFGIFPQGGRYPAEFSLGAPIIGTIINDPNVTPGFNPGFIAGAAWSAALPVFTGFVLGISGLGMRGNSIRVMESDYIRVARLRGLSESRIASRYLARNAVLPLYTTLMIGIAGIFSSGIIMERIFTYPAVGWYTFNALVQRDYPLLMGAFVFYTAVTIIGILIADFTYGFIDPRAGGGEEREAY